MNNAEITRSVRSVLEWEQELPALNSLMSAVRGGTAETDLSPTAAICFDSNVFLNLGKGSRADEVIDYLGKKHAGPIVLPSQVILELWNNHLTGIDAYVSRLSRQFEELNKTVEEIDPQYSGLKDGAKTLARDFQEEFGYVFNEKTRTDLLALLDMLTKTAIVSQLPRAEFSQVASLRKRTKTPPGFKDNGDGDFFVWAEFLQGLLLARTSGKDFDRALLVTDDVKKDWSKNGTPHPILSAELYALVEVPFGVMTLSELKGAVQRALA